MFSGVLDNVAVWLALLGLAVFVGVKLLQIRRKYLKLTPELPTLAFVGGELGWILSFKGNVLRSWNERPANTVVRHFLTYRGLPSNFEDLGVPR